jgi:hypothetical protein
LRCYEKGILSKSVFNDILLSIFPIEVFKSVHEFIDLILFESHLLAFFKNHILTILKNILLYWPVSLNFHFMVLYRSSLSGKCKFSKLERNKYEEIDYSSGNNQWFGECSIHFINWFQSPYNVGKQIIKI